MTSAQGHSNDKENEQPDDQFFHRNIVFDGTIKVANILLFNKGAFKKVTTYQQSGFKKWNRFNFERN
jgi:hypothetical protein